MTALARLLGDSMGGGPGLDAPREPEHPLRRTLTMLALFALLWAGIEVMTWSLGVASQPQLVSLLAWGACYGAARAYLSQRATARLLVTVRREIVQLASPAYLDEAAGEIERSITPMRRVVVPVLVAALASAATCWVVALEIGTADSFRSPEWAFAAAVYFLIFFVSARSVDAARFYLSLSRCLDEEQTRSLYVLGASESVLVKALAKLGGRVLVFWGQVFLLILSVMALALPLGDYRFAANGPLLMYLVPVLGGITLGVGSLGYLQGEAKIRATLQCFTKKQAAVLQRKINALFDPSSGRMPDDPDELRRLTDWQDRILAGGNYGSRAGAAISIALPFLLAVVSLIKNLAEPLF